MLFIDNADELQNNDSTPYGSYTFLTDSLDWAFCDNKWVFRQFLKFYDCILDAVSYHVEEFRNVTWDEFEDAVKSKHTHLVNLEMFIYYSECDLPNGYYCFNESLMNDFHADTAEYDVINEDYRYDWFELLEIVNSGWLVESPMVRDIRKFITKFCKCYALIHALMEHWYEICDDFDLPQNEWFSHLPDHAKVSLTKEANFPMLMDDLDEAEFVDNYGTGGDAFENVLYNYKIQGGLFLENYWLDREPIYCDFLFQRVQTDGQRCPDVYY